MGRLRGQSSSFRLEQRDLARLCSRHSCCPWIWLALGSAARENRASETTGRHISYNYHHVVRLRHSTAVYSPARVCTARHRNRVADNVFTRYTFFRRFVCEFCHIFICSSE